VTTGHVFIATSLDGFIARRDHSLDWLMKQPVQKEDHGYEAFMASVDGLIMGRASFQTVARFPDRPYAKPVVVLSQTLRDGDIPDHLLGKVRLSRAAPVALMAQLQAGGWKRACVDGGRVIQSFLRDGLIADMVVTTIPILIGDGVRLFGPLSGDIDLRLLNSRSFPSGLVSNHYATGPVRSE